MQNLKETEIPDTGFVIVVSPTGDGNFQAVMNMVPDANSSKEETGFFLCLANGIMKAIDNSPQELAALGAMHLSEKESESANDKVSNDIDDLFSSLDDDINNQAV